MKKIILLVVFILSLSFIFLAVKVSQQQNIVNLGLSTLMSDNGLVIYFQLPNIGARLYDLFLGMVLLSSLKTEMIK